MTLLSQETNQTIKRVKSPSEFLEQTIRDKYDGNENEFLKTLESHLINYKAYQWMKEDNFEKFIEEREKRIRSVIGKKIGADTELAVPSFTTPNTPYTKNENHD